MDKDEEIGGEENSEEGTQSNNLPPRALMGVFTPPETLAAATDMRHLADMLDNVSLRGDQRAGRQKVRTSGYAVTVLWTLYLINFLATCFTYIGFSGQIFLQC